MTEEQKIISGENYRKARDYFNLQSGWVLHHKDPSWQYENVERYISWNPEDLVPMTKSEHIALHNSLRGMSEETKKKISESCKKTMNTPEMKAKMSERATGRYKSEEEKQKTREATKKAMQRPEVKAKMIKANKGIPKSEEHKQHLGDNKRGKHWCMVYGKRVWFSEFV